ncbi:MAG: D-alanyl-D-alanine carboxypeptidase/D-alanyl-D-alanine-endopeptidase [Micrococcales bacterium]|nr:D-alanyl-D-alanine carboxypeptidase/D-alanyl-D-alanine-endopeptidase [Micrococcales bacterium]
MRARGWTAVGVAATLVLGGGTYAALDAYDVVPGPLTLADPWPEPAPFPTPPGAQAGPARPALDDLDAAAPLPSEAAVRAAISTLAADARMGPRVGVAVVDQITGEVLGSHAADTGLQPASVMKLIPGVAALTALDLDATLPTVAVLDGDRVVLVGGGDIMLGPGAGDPGVVDGRAGLGDLAAQTAEALRQAGVTTVRLGVDDSLFSGPTTAPGWSPSYVPDGYAAPVTALAVHIAKIDPSKEYGARHADPSLAAGAVFADRLTEQGITVTGRATRTSAPADAPRLGQVDSAPLRDVVGYFLLTSDNTVTEVVARLVAVSQGAPASFEGAGEAMLSVISGLGVDTTGARLADASGLAAGSSVTATMMAQVVLRATSVEHPALRDVIVSLPVAGLTGTLHDRFVTSDARGLVRAKTGSLPGVSSLAGTVVAAEGRALVFVVMTDEAPNGTAARPAIDRFVTALAAA